MKSKTKIKILIVEHDPGDLDLLHYQLKKGGINYEAKTVEIQADYVRALKVFIPDIILCDFSLPSFDGASAFKLQKKIAPDTPFLFVTGHIGEESSIEYIKNGVTDFVMKDKMFTLTTKIQRSLKESKQKRQKYLTEQQLGESEKRLKESQAIAQLGSWELNFATNVALLSDEACRIYGILPEEKKQTYESWESFIHPDDLESVLKANNDSLNKLSRTDLIHRIVLKDGTVKHIRSQSKFEFDRNGKVIGLYGTAHDVTAGKIADENLRKSEASLKEAQAIAKVGNWEINLASNSHRWSDEMYKIFGMTDNEATPSQELFVSFIYTDDLNYTNEKMAEAFRTLQSSSFDFRLVRKDGTFRYGYSEWRFDFDANQNPVRMFGIMQDVTERKMAEVERLKMVHDLMRRNKDLEQFTYIVSHNLRAPLANIGGLADALQMVKLNEEEVKQMTGDLSLSVKKLDSVIKDLNYILQVKKEVNERKEKVRFSELVEDIKLSIATFLQSNNYEIKYDFSEIDEFLTVKTYLYSIFYNLISNSMKYRQEQVPGKLEIVSHQEKNTIDLIFKDNGMGIDLQKRGDQVFGLYKRFHANIEGKGMGLFMVKTQVETLGGKISIKSEVNKGTEFNIEFEK